MPNNTNACYLILPIIFYTTIENIFDLIHTTHFFVNERTE